MPSPSSDVDGESSRRGKPQRISGAKRRGLMLDLGFAVVLFLAVMTYGANTPLTLSIASSAAYLLLPLAYLHHGEPLATARPFRTAALLLVGLAGWIFLQTMPLSRGLSGNPLWGSVAAFVDQPISTVSLTPGDAIVGLLKLVLPVGVFLSSLILFADEARGVRAFKGLAIAGGVVAMFSLLQFIVMPGVLLLEPKQFYRDSLTGPFVNRNTAGTFFGIVSVMLLALAFHTAGKIDRHALSGILDRGGKLEQPREMFAFLFFAALFLLTITALFLTRSRGATGATFLAMLLLALMMIFRPRIERTRRARKSRRQRLIRQAAKVALLVAVSAVMFAGLGSRVQWRMETQTSADPRFCALPSIWSAARDHWPLGAGFTSFEAVFPAYRDPACGVSGIWDKAHNFYFEGLFSLGFAFPLALAVVVFTLGSIFVRGLRSRRGRYYVVASGLCATLLVAVHAAFDFSLQIPGMATFFAALLGPVTTISLGKSARPRRQSYHEP